MQPSLTKRTVRQPGLFVRAVMAALAMMLLCSCSRIVPTSAAWEWETLTDGTVRITRCSISQPVIAVPETLGGAPVSAIGDEAFLGNSSISCVTLPETVVSVGNRAFMDCKALEKVNLGNVTAIGSQAFSGCGSLEAADFSDGLILLGKGAFENCSSLRSAVLPGSLEAVTERSFSGCGALESVQLEPGITFIGDYAFSECAALSAAAIPSSVTEVGDYAFYKCRNLAAIDLSANLGVCSFMGCSSLETVSIGKGAVSVCRQAFSLCFSLTEVSLPDTVALIDSGAFSGCSRLGRIELPDSVIEIGADAFAGCTDLTVVAANPSAGWLYASTYGFDYEEPPAPEDENGDAVE